MDHAFNCVASAERSPLRFPSLQSESCFQSFPGKWIQRANIGAVLTNPPARSLLARHPRLGFSRDGLRFRHLALAEPVRLRQHVEAGIGQPAQSAVYVPQTSEGGPTLRGLRAGLA